MSASAANGWWLFVAVALGADRDPVTDLRMLRDAWREAADDTTAPLENRSRLMLMAITTAHREVIPKLPPEMQEEARAELDTWAQHDLIARLSAKLALQDAATTGAVVSQGGSA